MELYSFKDDYSEGCHENIMQALINTNAEQHKTYGEDRYSKEAKELIKKKLNNPDSSIFFVGGGTGANLITISSFLYPHEAVISAQIGHIFTNEAGAIESCGHKVITTFCEDGILRVENLQSVLNEYDFFPHKVRPKLVYFSNATEIGTIYKKENLKKISAFCKENELFLYIDGARMAHALTSEDNDVSLEDLAKLTDAFTLGGTKNGALFGEAVVINNPKFAQYFSTNMKQKGSLFAKGRILGLQFLELFKDDLYFTLAQKANTQARILADGFEKKGYKTNDKVQTNQLFLTLPNSLIQKLQTKFNFYVFGKVDENHSTVRLVTSWATDNQKVLEMIEFI